MDFDTTLYVHPKCPNCLRLLGKIPPKFDNLKVQNVLTMSDIPVWIKGVPLAVQDDLVYTGTACFNLFEPAIEAARQAEEAARKPVTSLGDG